MENLRYRKSASKFKLLVHQKPNIKSGNQDEDICAICRGSYENMCHPNECFHKYCFSCLEKWTKIKPKCPYCQKKITSIIHSIQIDGTSEKYSLTQPASIYKQTNIVVDWPWHFKLLIGICFLLWICMFVTILTQNLYLTTALVLRIVMIIFIWVFIWLTSEP